VERSPPCARSSWRFGDKDKTVRSQAVRALGRIGPPAREAVPALTAMSRDSDVIVSREARVALESIGP
jgi:HEAT repeat protein